MGIYSLRKIFYIFLIFLFFLLYSNSVSAKELKFLIYSTKTYGEYLPEEFLKAYLENLQKILSKEEISFEVKSFSKEEAFRLLKAGIYNGIAEIKIITIKENLSIEWEFNQIGKKEPYYFYVTGQRENIEDLVNKTFKLIKSILEKNR